MIRKSLGLTVEVHGIRIGWIVCSEIKKVPSDSRAGRGSAGREPIARKFASEIAMVARISLLCGYGTCRIQEKTVVQKHP